MSVHPREPAITIVGLGPGPVSQLTPEAAETLLGADRVIVRTSAHPVCHWLRDQGHEVFAFDPLYELPHMTHAAIYEFMAAAVIKEAETRRRAVYGLPGHPLVFEATTDLILQQARREGMTVGVVPGVSFLEIVFARLQIDPAAGLQIGSSVDFAASDPGFVVSQRLIVGQLFARADPGRGTERPLEAVIRWVGARFPANHRASIVWTGPMPACETAVANFPVRDIRNRAATLDTVACGGTLYLPPHG